MNEKHLVWIVPMILIIGFVLGYVSGLNIPKDIKIGLDNETLELYNRVLDIEEEQGRYNLISDISQICDTEKCI